MIQPVTDDNVPPEPPLDERQPPQDLAAEQSVLGGMMLSKDAVADVVEVLRGGDFYRPAHEIIFSAILALYGRGEPVDPVTVAAELTRTGQIGKVGYAPYLHTLISTVPTAANAGYYAEIVAERATLRRLIEAGTRIVQLGYGVAAGTGGTVAEVADRAQVEVFDATSHRLAEDYIPMERLVGPVFDELEAISSQGGGLVGLPTGFMDLDELLHGLKPQQMITVAARPSAGKTTFALDIIREVSVKRRLTSVIFSLEMARTEIVMKVLAAEARVPLHHMQAGHLNDDDWTRLSFAMGAVTEAPIFVDDSPNLSIMEIRAKARRLKQRHDLRLVVVDYLQLMHGGTTRRDRNRQEEVSEYSRGLKLLAKELEVPVIAVSQLNRQSEQRADKRPMMSDLRESGAIEQDSDVVILVHRDDMYEPESPRAGIADLIVAKHRNGPTRTVEVGFQGHYSRFVDLLAETVR